MTLRGWSGRFYTHVFPHAQCNFPWDRTCSALRHQILTAWELKGSHSRRRIPRSVPGSYPGRLQAQSKTTKIFRKRVTHNFTSSSNIIRMRWAKRVASIVECEMYTRFWLTQSRDNCPKLIAQNECYKCVTVERLHQCILDSTSSGQSAILDASINGTEFLDQLNTYYRFRSKSKALIDILFVTDSSLHLPIFTHVPRQEPTFGNR
jgi:hypothetical protein